MDHSYSKPIQKTDDESKQFIIDSLQGDVTHGFDVDSLYCVNDNWFVFEYLKCDSKVVTPHTSSPFLYPWNWKKFYSLFKLSQQLNGRFFLVNYSTRDKDRDEVKVMEVLSLDREKVEKHCAEGKKGKCEYMTMKEYRMTRTSFSDWLRGLNAKATLPT